MKILNLSCFSMFEVQFFESTNQFDNSITISFWKTLKALIPYFKGIKSLLSDNTKFIPLNTDLSTWLNYIVNLEKKLNEHFKTLERDNKISEDEFKSICPIGTRPGILYGQPKVHKTVINNIPQFRPILSAINTTL